MRSLRTLFSIGRPRNFVFVIMALLLYYKYLTNKSNTNKEILKIPRLHINLSHLANCNIFFPSSYKKKNWHNYTQIEIDKNRVGNGENGIAAMEAFKQQNEAIKRHLFSIYDYNVDLGDKIALDRSLPDTRHHLCKNKTYLESLPSISIIIPFRNEYFSTLLRTVYSVLNRSPEHLVKEIFLVDDASTKEFLKEKLDNYVKEHFTKVKVVRVESRGGLITARLAGAMKATGDVLLFMDSHSEVNVNWLPPLLEPIALDYRVVVCPFIDTINYDTFEYISEDEGARGAFDWRLYYRQLPMLPKDVENLPEPFENPIMIGGLFAISRRFFWELGGYDTGLRIWGAEQFELSFKIWMCGGRMVDTVCSRIGHIYRKSLSIHNSDLRNFGDFFGRNRRRVAEVWMDEYARYLYEAMPRLLTIDPGDLTEQKAIRQRLKCKPFKWFMTQVAFDFLQHYPITKSKPYGEGHIRPLLNPNMCADAQQGHRGKVTLKICSDNDETQYFYFTEFKDIKLKKRDLCWDSSLLQLNILLRFCHHEGGNQKWKYNEVTKHILHRDGTCLDHNPFTYKMFVTKCNKYLSSQKWIVDTVNKERLDRWDDEIVRITGPVEEWKGEPDLQTN